MSLKLNRLWHSQRAAAKKTRGENMKVSPIMLLKTHVEKMSETGHATICMKTIHLEVARHYIDEKKDVTRNSSLAVAAIFHQGSLLSQAPSARNRQSLLSQEPYSRGRRSRLDGSRENAGKIRGAI
jgi:hypothetical protein